MKWIGWLVLLASIAPAVSAEGKSELEYMADAEIICEHESTTRGQLDGSRYRYCMSRQREGYAKIVEMVDAYPDSFFVQYAAPNCYASWTKRGVSNSSMIAYCLQNEVEGYKDVRYYADKFGVEPVFDEARKGLRRSGTWTGAAYLVKKKFDPAP